jgi:hypothetical protein
LIVNEARSVIFFEKNVMHLRFAIGRGLLEFVDLGIFSSETGFALVTARNSECPDGRAKKQLGFVD